MAKVSVTICDRCGVKSGDGKVSVNDWSCRRQGMKMSGDLCERCWNELVVTFRPSRVMRNKGKIEVVDINSIQRNRS
jgi:hypothetical protein